MKLSDKQVSFYFVFLKRREEKRRDKVNLDDKMVDFYLKLKYLYLVRKF